MSLGRYDYCDQPISECACDTHPRPDLDAVTLNVIVMLRELELLADDEPLVF